MNNCQFNTAAGLNGSAADLEIPPFLRRQRSDEEEQMIPDTNEAPPELAADTMPDNPAAQVEMPIDEAIPTLEDLIVVIRKLGNKIEEYSEQRRILKKQLETMVKKL